MPRNPPVCSCDQLGKKGKATNVWVVNLKCGDEWNGDAWATVDAPAGSCG